MEGTYEYELERAELLGVNPPDRAQWELQNKARLEAEAEQEQTEVAQELESEGEGLKRTQGKMEELNNILNATQVKINKFKVSTKMVKFDTFFDEIFLFQTVCGSFTSLLKIRSASPAPGDAAAASSSDNQTSSNGGAPSTSINTALDDLEKMKEVNQQSDYKFAKNQVLDISSKINKNNDALDSLLAKSERAEIALQQQNKQVSKFLR
jgi:hypothetical protein